MTDAATDDDRRREAVAAAVAAIEAHYETLEVGTKVVKTQTYDADDIAEYVERVGIDYPGQHVGEDGNLLVPPGMVFFRPAQAFGVHEGPAMAQGGFFTAAKRSYRSAVRVGEPLQVEGTLAEKFERGGYYYIVAEWRAVGADGREVGAGREEHTLGSARKPRP